MCRRFEAGHSSIVMLHCGQGPSTVVRVPAKESMCATVTPTC